MHDEVVYQLQGVEAYVEQLRAGNGFITMTLHRAGADETDVMARHTVTESVSAPAPLGTAVTQGVNLNRLGAGRDHCRPPRAPPARNPGRMPEPLPHVTMQELGINTPEGFEDLALTGGGFKRRRLVASKAVSDRPSETETETEKEKESKPGRWRRHCMCPGGPLLQDCKRGGTAKDGGRCQGASWQGDVEDNNGYNGFESDHDTGTSARCSTLPVLVAGDVVVGDRVEARFNGDAWWYPGTVERVRDGGEGEGEDEGAGEDAGAGAGAGSVDIQYDDGDREVGVSLLLVKLVAKRKRKRKKQRSEA